MRSMPVPALLLGLVLLAPAGLGAQEEPSERTEAPAMAEAPEAFRLGPTVDVLTWTEGPGPTPEDATLWGLAVERLLDQVLAVRLGLAHGSGSVAGGGQEVDVGTYVADLSLLVRGRLPRAAEAGVVPFGAVGVGTVVHDPADDDLSTASQNALSYGLGVDVRALNRFGARVEWRRYAVNLENIFDPVDRSGSSRDADRFQAVLYWAF